jgi:hypothetical protein
LPKGQRPKGVRGREAYWLKTKKQRLKEKAKKRKSCRRVREEIKGRGSREVKSFKHWG